MAAGEEDTVTLDAETGREIGLPEDDFVLLTQTGLPADAGGYFRTDIPDGPFGLFTVHPLHEDGPALILGGAGSDGGALYFLDVNDGVVVLLSLGGADEEPRFEIVNTTLGAFVWFVRLVGAYERSPRAERPADDRARLVKIAEALEEIDPDAFRHPHRWWAMVIARLRREVAKRERTHSPAQSHSDAFDRALDRLDEAGWRHVTGKEFASATGEYGLLTLPDEFTDAFSADGVLCRDVDVQWRGSLTSQIQSAFAWEGLVVRVPEEPEGGEAEDDFDAAMERLLAAAHDPQEPDEGTVTCLATAETSDLCRILRAFGHLAARGYVAEPALWPTTSGCWQRVAERTEDPGSPRAVFWNTQSHDMAFDSRGDLVDELYLGWAGDPAEIAEALAGTGLTVKVPADEKTTFILAPAARPRT
ncbi:SUKH-4 family immunity protein [Actinomadura kijaniata]|uniref:SUKH-4 family immunity protein n=1 Tax=Actinomadura kijaniata TaxID=46161 RepID=UPI0008310383|nr:SUKH-4 family immunity protein [Actinomadura kijaniata]